MDKCARKNMIIVFIITIVSILISFVMIITNTKEGFGLKKQSANSKKTVRPKSDPGQRAPS